MPSFTDVVAGNPTLASDLNQIVDRLNASVSAGVQVTGGASAFVPYQGFFSAAPGAGFSTVFGALISADTAFRAALSIRSDGYGQLSIGAGTSVAGNLYGVSSGLKTDQSLTVVGALTAQGTTTLAGFTASGTGTISGAASMGSTLSVTGAATFSSTIAASGLISTNSGANILSAGVVYTGGGSSWFGNDGAYTYIDGNLSFNVRKNGTHAMRADTVANWNVSGSFYGFITAEPSLFGAGTGNADIAEPLLTTPGTQAGMAVCIVANDTVGPCPHVACKRAKVISTQPSILMKARVRNDDNLTPIEGHESALPVAVGGAVPVQMAPGEVVALGDFLTTAGQGAPGKLKKAREDEYALADVINIEPDGTIWAWLH